MSPISRNRRLPHTVGYDSLPMFLNIHTYVTKNFLLYVADIKILRGI